MSHKVFMPALGMNQDTGIIAEWAKKEGDFVAVGDVLMEVETDKAVQEIEAVACGYLSDIKYPAGADVPVGEVVALIVEQMPVSGRQPPESQTAPSKTELKKPDQKRRRGQKPPEKVPHTEPQLAIADDTEPTPESLPLRNPRNPNHKGNGGASRNLASPKAKHLAHQLGIKVDQVAGKAGNPIHNEDVLATARKLIHLGLQEQGEGLSKKANARITVRVDAKNIKDCDAWLREKTPNISMGHLVAALAVSQLRATGIFGPDASIRVLVDVWIGGEIESSMVSDPDKSRVSQIEIQNRTESDSGDMRVICIHSSRISGLELVENSIPTIIVFVNDENLSAHLFGFESMFSPDVMKFSDNLALALEQPLLHLV